MAFRHESTRRVANLHLFSRAGGLRAVPLRVFHPVRTLLKIIAWAAKPRDFRGTFLISFTLGREM